MKALKLHTKAAGIFNSIGNVYKEIGKHLNASIKYDKALKLNPII